MNAGQPPQVRRILPILINGELIYAAPEDCHQIEYETGAVVLIPRLTAEHVAALSSAPRSALDVLDLDDITIFLDRVAAAWSDAGNPLRCEAIRLGAAVTGFSPELMAEDHARLASALGRAKLYDIVDADLGNSLLLDHWMPYHSVLLKARPVGRVLHVMVGNVPLAGFFTVIRSVLTKNTTIAKLPSRDPVSCLMFARAFHDIDPGHPVTRSLSVVYWPGGDPVEDELIGASDVVCAWGGEDSIDALKRKIPRNTGFLEFGPKESLMLIGPPLDDVEHLAMRAAFDISAYEQEACFSPQRIFIEGDPGPSSITSLPGSTSSSCGCRSAGARWTRWPTSPAPGRLPSLRAVMSGMRPAESGPLSPARRTISRDEITRWAGRCSFTGSPASWMSSRTSIPRSRRSESIRGAARSISPTRPPLPEPPG